MAVMVAVPSGAHRRRAEAVLSELAAYRPGWQGAFMPVRITISGVSEDLRDRLAARAASERQSMQEFLRGERERIAFRIFPRRVVAGCPPPQAGNGYRVAASRILNARDADRT